MSKLWGALPLHTAVVEFLEKRQGVSTDADLLKALKEYYEDLSFREFNKTLMRLEVEGIIRVFTLTKNLKRIEMVSEN